MADRRIVEALDPEAAFSILADGTRLAILRALWEDDEREVTFTELREATGVRDPGQFNYHLQKLRSRFVRKTEAGYELSPAGRHVLGSLLAGAFTKTGEIGPLSVDHPCPSCGEPMAFRYEDENADVFCAACDLHNSYPVAAGVFAGYEPDELPHVAERYARTVFHRVRNGFCHYCDGPVRPTVRPAREAFDDAEGEVPEIATVQYDCGRCHSTFTMDLGSALFTTPAVVAFHRDHGVDTEAVPIWRFSVVEEGRSRVTSEEPFRAVVTYAVDDARLALTVDRSLDVVATDRSDSG